LRNGSEIDDLLMQVPTREEESKEGQGEAFADASAGLEALRGIDWGRNEIWT
jgi:hypothetical protein